MVGRRGGWGLVLMLFASPWLACEGEGLPPQQGNGCWREEGGGPRAAPPPFPWERQLRVLEGGVTEWAEVPLGGAASVALRLAAPPGSAACVQLDTVEGLAGSPWVIPPASWRDLGSYCMSCPQRVSVGAGSGFYVLPSNERPPPPTELLRVRAALRDCETFLPGDPAPQGGPTFLRLQAQPLEAPPAQREGLIRLALVFTPGSIFFDGETARETLGEALRLVNQELRPGRLRVEVARSRDLSVDGMEPLSFTPGNMGALERVLGLLRTCPGDGAMALTREVPVIFAGCLLEEEPLTRQTRRPLGRVTHIPGGLVTKDGADGIFLSGRHCDPPGARFSWPATTVARLLAHELGHFLGLYHSVEGDGIQDQLEDTGADNAMYFNPVMSSAQGFSPGQFQVMRRHPAVSYE